MGFYSNIYQPIQKIILGVRKQTQKECIDWTLLMFASALGRKRIIKKLLEFETQKETSHIKVKL
jgi:hypothetical protein